MQRATLVLLAIASVGTTTLIVFNVMARRSDTPVDRARSGAEVNPPMMTALPGFSLTRQDGGEVTLDHLRGKVWIADFVFTRCAGPCPMLTSRMAEIAGGLDQRSGWEGVRLVTFTADPGHDTPAVLRGYARLAHADETRWLFLTGRREEVWRVIKDGFKLPVFDNAEDPMMPIAHSQKFVLVDRLGWVRGYYDALTGEGMTRLMSDVERVVREPARGAGWASSTED